MFMCSNGVSSSDQLLGSLKFALTFSRTPAALGKEIEHEEKPEVTGENLTRKALIITAYLNPGKTVAAWKKTPESFHWKGWSQFKSHCYIFISLYRNRYVHYNPLQIGGSKKTNELLSAASLPGVPQRGDLSPVLFNIFTFELSDIVTSYFVIWQTTHPWILLLWNTIPQKPIFVQRTVHESFKKRSYNLLSELFRWAHCQLLFSPRTESSENIIAPTWGNSIELTWKPYSELKLEITTLVHEIAVVEFN